MNAKCEICRRVNVRKKVVYDLHVESWYRLEANEVGDSLAKHGVF